MTSDMDLGAPDPAGRLDSATKPARDGRTTRRVRRLVALLTVFAVVAGIVSAAVAAVSVSGSDGGSTIGVSISTGTSVPGISWPGKGASSSDSGPVCQYTGLRTDSSGAITGFGGGSPGSLFLMACPGWSIGFGGGGLLWVPVRQPAPARTRTIDPAAVASRAEKSIGLPSPMVRLNPEPFSVVNIATWMWIDPGLWHPYSASASVGSVTARAVATPESVRWTMGDGSIVVCTGPGTPFRLGVPASVQSTSCSYVYRSSSAGQASPNGNPNDAAFAVSATITWGVNWSSSVPGSGGVLAPLQTESTTHLRVEQVQSVDTVQ
jgi:hypothetical protein